MALASHQATVLASPNLLGYWRLGEAAGTAGTNSVVDETGAGFHGTPTGGVTFGVAGAVYGDSDRAADFDGVNDYLSFGNITRWNLATFSTRAWVKTSAPGAGYRTIFGVSNRCLLYLVDGVLGLFDWGTSTFRSTGINIADGRWHRVGVSNQTGLATGTVIYLDGTNRLSTTVTHTASGELVAGGLPNQPQYLNGTIDEVAFNSGVLSAAAFDEDFRSAQPQFSGKGGLGVGSRTALSRTSLPALTARSGMGIGSKGSLTLPVRLTARSGMGVGSRSALEIVYDMALPGIEARLVWNDGIVLNRRVDDADLPVYPHYAIDSIIGRGDTADADLNTEPRTGARGEIPRRSKRGGKTESYKGSIIARSLTDLRKAETAMKAAFDDLSEGRLTIKPHPLLNLFYDFYTRARVISLSIPDEQTAGPNRTSLGYERPFVLSVRLSDGLYLESSERKKFSGAIVSNKITVPCRHRGTTAAFPILRAHGPVTAPVLANASIGQELRFPSLTIAAGVFLEVDFATRAIRLAALAPPARPVATPSTTGGTLAAGTYFYRVTALNASGETVGSLEAFAITTGSTGSVALSWPAVTGATSYRVYGRAQGAQALYFNTAIPSFTDTGGLSADPNLVTNPSVETDLAGYDGAGSSYLNATTVARDNTRAKSGSWSVRADAADGVRGVQYRPPGTFRAGQAYTFAVEVWQGSARGLELRLGAGTVEMGPITTFTPIAGGWTRASVTWTPTVDRTDVFAVVRTPGAASPVESFWADEWMVVKGTVAPVFGSPTVPTVNSAATQTAGLDQRHLFERQTSRWFDAGVPGLLPNSTDDLTLSGSPLSAGAKLEVFFHHTVV
jgi:hypothetical protein